MESVLQGVLASRDKYTDELTQYTELLRSRSDKSKLGVYAMQRGIGEKFVESFGIFYIGRATEMLLPRYLDKLEDFGLISKANNRPIFNERYIMPIYDVDGRVLNLVGYSKESKERYIYGTAKYYMRRDTLYGLESLESAYSKGYAILTEGITDCQRLRSLGYKNSFAMCGTHRSEYIRQQLSRCRYGVIEIPDRDIAGLKAKRSWKYSRSVTIYIKRGYKDIDEMLRTREMCELFNEYMAIVIKELTSCTLPMEKETTII